jgi:hypothetical protein
MPGTDPALPSSSGNSGGGTWPRIPANAIERQSKVNCSSEIRNVPTPIIGLRLVKCLPDTPGRVRRMQGRPDSGGRLRRASPASTGGLAYLCDGISLPAQSSLSSMSSNFSWYIVPPVLKKPALLPLPPKSAIPMRLLSTSSLRSRASESPSRISRPSTTP